MRKLIQAALDISFVLAVLSMIVMLIGHDYQIQSEFFRYFGRCDGKPCYLGIIPGKTSWDETVRIFEETPAMQFDPDTNIASNPPGFNGSGLIFASSEDEAVDEIDLAMRSPDVNARSLVEQFGFPCAVVVTPGAQIGMIYPGMSVIINSEQLGATQVLRPTTFVHQINLFSRFQSCDQVFGGIPITHLWKGFVRYSN